MIRDSFPNILRPQSWRLNGFCICLHYGIYNDFLKVLYYPVVQYNRNVRHVCSHHVQVLPQLRAYTKIIHIFFFFSWKVNFLKYQTVCKVKLQTNMTDKMSTASPVKGRSVMSIKPSLLISVHDISQLCCILESDWSE